MRVRSLVFAVSVSALALAACTQSVEGPVGESSDPVIKSLPTPDPCQGWQSNVRETGVIVRLTPRAPRLYWSCPSLRVNRTSVEGYMTADLIAWYEAHPLAMQYTCGVGPKEALPVLYQAAWPEVTDPHLPYCVYEGSVPLGDLSTAIDQQIGSQVAWKGPLYGIMLGAWEPSGGSCPSCNERKLP